MNFIVRKKNLFQICPHRRPRINRTGDYCRRYRHARHESDHGRGENECANLPDDYFFARPDLFPPESTLK